MRTHSFHQACAGSNTQDLSYGAWQEKYPGTNNSLGTLNATIRSLILSVHCSGAAAGAGWACRGQCAQRPVQAVIAGLLLRPRHGLARRWLSQLSGLLVGAHPTAQSVCTLLSLFTHIGDCKHRKPRPLQSNA
jgi:hypothetical protein